MYFKCQNLKKYIDSILFDSGETIAIMITKENNKQIEISLVVTGKVNIEYKDDIYKIPSQFPLDLKNLIMTNKYWDCEDYVFVNNNNWFEFICKINNEEIDGIICEKDISKCSMIEIKEDMLEIVQEILNKYCL